MSHSEFGPLEPLVGTWCGEKGLDVAPDRKGSTETPFYETIKINPVGSVQNAKEQTLLSLRYHQVVTKKSDDSIFHDQMGYWIWDAEQNIVMHSLQIPRAVSLLAGGNIEHTDDQITYLVKAEAGHSDWGIVQQPFMQKKAKTLSFSYRATIQQNQLSYYQTTLLDIYGKQFEHTDCNELERKN